jgi:hypothetical protein
MSRAAAWLLAVALLGACKSERSPPPRGMDRPREVTTDQAPATTPASSPSAQHRPGSLPSGSPWVPRISTPETEAPSPGSRSTLAPAPEPEDPQAPALRTPERDLGAELHAAIGDPVGCLAPLDPASLPAQIDIRVDGRISATGVVTEANVQAPSLPEEARRCVERMASAARLQGPVPGAPRSVRTTLSLARRDPAPELP